MRLPNCLGTHRTQYGEHEGMLSPAGTWLISPTFILSVPSHFRAWHRPTTQHHDKTTNCTNNFVNGWSMVWSERKL